MNYSLCINKFKFLFGALLISLTLVACQDDHEEQDGPAVVAAEPTEIQFSLVDSIKVDPLFSTSAAEVYANLNRKTYKVASENKTVAFFYEGDNEVVLYFREISDEAISPLISLTFKNRTMNQLPVSFSAKDANVVCIETGQSFADGSAALSAGCEVILDGSGTFQYDKATDALSGSISKLKYSLDFYVPEYSFPNFALGTILKASGSSRNVTISFKNIKRRK